MTAAFRLLGSAVSTPAEGAADLRAEVRAFLDEERRAGAIRPGRQSWTTWDRGFSERAAARGYVAMTWPREFGGLDRTPFERYVVCEEMLAAGAPQGSHWIADRQSGPQIMRNGTEALKRKILPEIAAGRCTFGIGMSEPDSGSQLSSIRTQADRTEGGFVLNGAKVWTTNAQHAEYIICLCRTDPKRGRPLRRSFATRGPHELRRGRGAADEEHRGRTGTQRDHLL